MLARILHMNHETDTLRRRRGNEADGSQAGGDPPPHVGGYESRDSTRFARMIARIHCIALVCWTFVGAARMDGAVGETAVVVFNSAMPDSRAVAEYYARKRHVPTNQVIGFELPIGENMTRAEYQEKLERPLLDALEERGLFTFRTDLKPATREKPGEIIRTLVGASVRNVVLCFGVPLRIVRDAKLDEPGAEKVRVELRRNEAAVDSELCLLPSAGKLPLVGPVVNRFYATTNAASLHPTNGIILVARLDGPTPEIARGLVDKALLAERDGLWGRAYFDSRGLAEGNYKLGDDWIRESAQIARRFGFETILDTNAATFPVSYPLSQVALYSGWYDGNVSGPFSSGQVEFMPGAVAYHLHSFSARTLRSRTENWVGPLLDRGVTATMGCVDEPYLEGTPELGTFFSRLLFLGFSFGEAAYAAQSSLSWQTTVVGDPLYRPFGRKPQVYHEELLRRNSPLIEWSHLKIVNLNLLIDRPLNELVAYLHETPGAGTSPVLLEKLAELLMSKSRETEAIPNFRAALNFASSKQQRIRLSLRLAGVFETLGRDREAFDSYEAFLKAFADYPDRAGVYQKLHKLAGVLGRKNDQQRYERLLQPNGGS